MGRIMTVAFVFSILTKAHGQPKAHGQLFRPNMMFKHMANDIDKYDDKGFEEYDDEEHEEFRSEDQLHRMHAKFDVDSDGKVSLQEVMAFYDSVENSTASTNTVEYLEDLDTNKDGFLSLEEHLNGMHYELDSGDDEKKTEVEHQKRLQFLTVETAKFKAADINGDGKLDKSELISLFQPETHEGVLKVTVEETMRQMDTNKDGKLTAAEFWENNQRDYHDADLSKEGKGT